MTPSYDPTNQDFAHKKAFGKYKTFTWQELIDISHDFADDEHTRVHDWLMWVIEEAEWVGDDLRSWLEVELGDFI